MTEWEKEQIAALKNEAELAGIELTIDQAMIIFRLGMPIETLSRFTTIPLPEIEENG